jgi:hypothetical protein
MDLTTHIPEKPPKYYIAYARERHPLTAQARVKIYVSGGRHSINLPSELVRDSAFPFKPLEELVARIDGKRVVIERP